MQDRYWTNMGKNFRIEHQKQQTTIVVQFDTRAQMLNLTLHLINHKLGHYRLSKQQSTAWWRRKDGIRLISVLIDTLTCSIRVRSKYVVLSHPYSKYKGFSHNNTVDVLLPPFMHYSWEKLLQQKIYISFLLLLLFICMFFHTCQTSTVSQNWLKITLRKIAAAAEL